MDGAVVRQSRKELEWRQRLDRFAASGQQIKRFCESESVTEATFYRWRKRLAKSGGAALAADFIDVGVMPPAPLARSIAQRESASATLEVHLDLGGGLTLHIVRR